MTNQAVIYQRHKSADGHYIIQATLNSERSLNALNQDMIDSLLPAIEQWQQDDSVVAIVLDSAGDKAFCAGGDVVELHRAMAEAPGTRQPFVQEYFSKEYELDYKIHAFSKPVILWGNGFVMGGGLGLMAGASHRIVTENSKIAMPEITIGLYPDVGATYFLSRMPQRLGLFLGLTAAQMNAADSLEVNLADFYLAHQQKNTLIAQLAQTNWSQSSDHHQLINQLISELKPTTPMPVGNIEAHRSVLKELLAPAALEDVVEAILAMDSDDKWLNKAKRTLAHGSALSAKILERQLIVGQQLSLLDCFKLELAMSVHCGEIGEVTEGIRALLVDKDNNPNWQFKSLDEVEPSLIDRIFTPIWDEDNHPLRALT